MTKTDQIFDLFSSSDPCFVSCLFPTQSLRQSNVMAAIQCSPQVSLQVSILGQGQIDRSYNKPEFTDKHYPMYSQPRHNKTRIWHILLYMLVKYLCKM